MKMLHNITVIMMSTGMIGLFACDKPAIYNGNINLDVKYNRQPVPDINVYYYSGLLASDSLGNIKYWGMQHTDFAGNATFRQLAPGPYHFTASSYLKEAGRIVKADTVLTVRKRYRDESNYKVALALH